MNDKDDLDLSVEDRKRIDEILKKTENLSKEERLKNSMSFEEFRKSSEEHLARLIREKRKREEDTHNTGK